MESPRRHRCGKVGRDGTRGLERLFAGGSAAVALATAASSIAAKCGKGGSGKGSGDGTGDRGDNHDAEMHGHDELENEPNDDKGMAENEPGDDNGASPHRTIVS